MATQEPTPSPTEATPEPTEESEESSTTVSFTQVVSAADVACEEAKGEVQTANAQTLEVPVSSVQVSGCDDEVATGGKRRVLAGDESADNYEFFIKIVADSLEEVDRLETMVSSSNFADQVSQRLIGMNSAGVAITQSSSPVVEHESVSENSDSEDQESDSQFNVVLLGVVFVLVIVFICAAFYCCCRKKVAQKGSGICEQGSATEGSRPTGVDVL